MDGKALAERIRGDVAREISEAGRQFDSRASTSSTARNAAATPASVVRASAPRASISRIVPIA